MSAYVLSQQGAPKCSLDDFTVGLFTWLSAEAVKSRKPRRSLKRMFLDLGELVCEEEKSAGGKQT